MKKQTSSITLSQSTKISLVSAILCIIAPFSIPLPLNLVPLSLATLILYFSLYLLSTKEALLSCCIYLLLGLIGLPVFSNFSGGIHKLLGPSGGYLFGYLLLLLISGFFIQKWPSNPIKHAIGMCLGTLACYTIGTVWLALQMSLTPIAALWAGVFPFLLGDSIKILLALSLGPILRTRIIKTSTDIKKQE